MRKFFLLFFLLPLSCFSQLKVGVKAGLNLANVTSSPDLSTNLYAGYFVGGYIAPKQKKVVGYRSELILSRQGYDYKTSSNTGNVDLDYLLLPQLIVLKFTKKFQVQLGGQIAFLLNAAVDSSGGSGNGSLFNYFKRFDYGAVGGFEVSPFSGFFIGSRLNVSLQNIGKELPVNGNNPSFVPKDLIRNNVLQVYLGWRF
jgi:hypothetical protein